MPEEFTGGNLYMHRTRDCPIGQPLVRCL